MGTLYTLRSSHEKLARNCQNSWLTHLPIVKFTENWNFSTAGGTSHSHILAFAYRYRLSLSFLSTLPFLLPLDPPLPFLPSPFIPPSPYILLHSHLPFPSTSKFSSSSQLTPIYFFPSPPPMILMPTPTIHPKVTSIILIILPFPLPLVNMHMLVKWEWMFCEQLAACQRQPESDIPLSRSIASIIMLFGNYWINWLQSGTTLQRGYSYRLIGGK